MLQKAFCQGFGNALVSVYIGPIVGNLCKTGRLTSLCVEHLVKNAGLADLFNFSRYASLQCKGLELAMLVYWSTPKCVLEC